MSEHSNPAVLASAYKQLLNLLVETPNLDAFLRNVAKLAADVVTPTAACGITFRHNGQPVTVATSEPLAAQVDEIQYGAGEGPCLDALRYGDVLQVDDLTIEPRWDIYRPHAIAHGVLSSLSLPLAVGDETVGAINLYGDTRGAFGPPERQHAEAFAAQASAALTLTVRQARQTETQAQLQQAMASRSVIDHAIGILMGQQRCDAATAFDLLRRASQHRNRKLRDIAVEIVTNVSGQPPAPPTAFAPNDHDE